MGIKGLHKIIAHECRPVHLREFAGQIGGIDAFCWIYAAKSVAEKGEADQNVTFQDYLRRKIQLFITNGVKPVLVLDGRRLLAKAGTHAKRAAQKRKYSGKFVELPIQSSLVGPSVAIRLVQIAREMKVDYIVSLYESDAQLAYLSTIKKVDFVVTEDADLLVYGCERVLFKLGFNAVGSYFESDKLADCLGFKKENYSLEKLRHIAILSGCDYLENARGFGIKNAIKAVKKYPTGGIEQYLVQIQEKVGKAAIPDNYEQKFTEAEFVFMCQLVFDIQYRQVVPFSPHPDPLPVDNIDIAGEDMNEVLALELATGNLDPFTLEQNELEYFDVGAVGEDSIWSEGHFNNSEIKPIAASRMNVVDDQENIKWECHCGIMFDEPGELKSHLMTHKRTRTCSVCGYVAVNPSHLTTHVRIHTGERPFVCETEGCGASFKQKSTLTGHQRIHSEERNFACQAEGCTAAFKTPNGLRAHGFTHSGERKYACQAEGCNATFKCQQNLRQHKILCHSARRFKCDFEGCVKTFPTKERLNQHKLTHGEERNYSCPFPGCKQAFKTRRVLDHHKLIHAKPFACDQCEKRFDQEDLLKKHIATHSLPYKCKTCGQGFSRKDSLQRHKTIHSTKRQLFTCRTCKMTFAYAHTLKRHMKTHNRDTA